MTNPPTPERGTLFDLPFETARARISSLHAAASAKPVAASPRGTTGSHQPSLRRLRSALGSRLVEMGSALLADDGAPRSLTRT